MYDIPFFNLVTGNFETGMFAGVRVLEEKQLGEIVANNSPNCSLCPSVHSGSVFKIFCKDWSLGRNFESSILQTHSISCSPVFAPISLRSYELTLQVLEELLFVFDVIKYVVERKNDIAFENAVIFDGHIDFVQHHHFKTSCYELVVCDLQFSLLKDTAGVSAFNDLNCGTNSFKMFLSFGDKVCQLDIGINFQRRICVEVVCRKPAFLSWVETNCQLYRILIRCDDEYTKEQFMRRIILTDVTERFVAILAINYVTVFGYEDRRNPFTTFHRSHQRTNMCGFRVTICVKEFEILTWFTNKNDLFFFLRFHIYNVLNFSIG